MMKTKGLSALGFVAIAALPATSMFGQDIGKEMVARIELLSTKPCIHVVALQDDFSASREGTDFQLALYWHSYVQGVADSLFPAQDNAFQTAMSELQRLCLTSPDMPISELTQVLALMRGP